MPQMAAAPGAVHLDAGHADGSVDRCFDRFGKRHEEARPSSSAVEFRLGGEQRLTARGARELPASLLNVELAASARFRMMFAKHPILLGTQRPPPFIVGSDDLILHSYECTRSISDTRLDSFAASGTEKNPDLVVKIG
jgi:hypothetical protein